MPTEKRDDGRRHRDRDDQRRKDRHRDEINGDEKHRRKKDDDDRRHRDEDRRSRHKDEDERERQRRERREKKEGRKVDGDGRKVKEEDRKNKHILEDDSDDELRHRKDRDRLDERERRRKQKELEEQKRRGKDQDKKRSKGDTDREKRQKFVISDDEDNSDRHKKDRDRERRRREDEEKKILRGHDDEKRQSTRDEDKERRHQRDRVEGRQRDQIDDETDKKKDRHKDRYREEDDERERQRHERRERREGKDKDRDKDRERRKREEEEEERRRRKREEKERLEREREEKERKNRERNEDRYTSGIKKEEDRGITHNNVEEDDYGGYDDDFEDYDEDFEDDEEHSKEETKNTLNKLENARHAALDYSDNEMNDLLKALDQENEILLKESREVSARQRQRNRFEEHETLSNSTQDLSDPEQPVKPSRSRTLINFVGAKKQVMNTVANRVIGKRAQDLLQMIELDSASFDIFDMPPVKEYDLYIRSFGRSDTIQAYVQTNDDNIDRDIQTEEIDQRQKWTQHPPEDFAGCGRGDGEKDLDEEQESMLNKQPDLRRLSKFVQKAGQVMSILLDENSSGTGEKTDLKANKSQIKICEGYTQLGNLGFLSGRYVQFAQFSPSEPNMLLTVYSASDQESNPLSMKGLLCVWNTNDSSYPQRILGCESQPTCCCFSPFKSSLAFAGTVDGSLCSWDLRESSSQHKSLSDGNADHIIRYPTYNTASVLDTDNHHSPVTTINPVANYSLSESSADKAEGSGLSFQLVSLEEQGIINFWVVAEIMNPDTAGSETDLGLSPGGKIKLIKSSSITLQHPLRYIKAGVTFRAFELQLAPTDTNHFYVGTDAGYILHGLRFGNKAFPSSHTVSCDTPLNVNSVDFSPFGHPCFLASCNDGSVHLFSTKSATPLVTWPSKLWDSQDLTCVRWSRSRPCVFYVLDGTSRLYTFDILEGDTLPVQVDTLSQDRVMYLTFTTDSHKSRHSRKQKMLVAAESGKTEIHTLSDQYRETKTLENEFMPTFLSRF